MAIIETYLNYTIGGGSLANRAPNDTVRYMCELESDLPTVNVIEGDRAYTLDSGKRWTRTSGTWVLQTSDNLATAIMLPDETVLDIDAIADGQFLKRDGLAVVGAAGSGGAAWGSITGTLSAQTDLQTALDAKLATTGNGSGLTGLTKAQVGLANADNTSDANKPISTATQTALDGKQVAGSYATGTGSANGTNTGDQTSIVGISGSLAEFNTALTGADFATGGGTVTGASSGTNTGDQTSVSGNAGTATTLQTPRTINGASFNGSANIQSKLDDAAAADDNTDLNTSTAAHGLMPKLSNVAGEFFNGVGAWTVPAGGSGLTQPQVMARTLRC